jgi:hypothetical protein
MSLLRSNEEIVRPSEGCWDSEVQKSEICICRSPHGSARGLCFGVLIHLLLSPLCIFGIKAHSPRAEERPVAHVGPRFCERKSSRRSHEVSAPRLAGGRCAAALIHQPEQRYSSFDISIAAPSLAASMKPSRWIFLGSPPQRASAHRHCEIPIAVPPEQPSRGYPATPRESKAPRPVWEDQETLEMDEWHHVSMRVHATSPVARVSGAGQWVPLSDFSGFGNNGRRPICRDLAGFRKGLLDMTL